MGVPKFYRWISERYPQINQVITDSALLPEFDHLYLDMNGIIHGCTHPAHLENSSESLSERDMMMGIMHYIDRIVTQIVKPKVSVYMAIDGVAPRAKLNQQRSRRFRSAKDMADAAASEKATLLHDPTKGGSDDTATAAASSSNTGFDSNCITPGTEFMARVSEAIKYFIRKKIKEDPLWRNLRIVFSGHEIPGEGEHKIMQHLREMKSNPNYQPNTRHCMYGQDADLIMLGLVSHEPHFTLLREIVDFGMGFQSNNKNALKAVKKFTKESDFQLLHLSILREYLDLEFGYHLSSEEKELSGYNLERIIDDFVFMTFLVGNDFLPHLPSLDIGDQAFDLLFDTYRTQRITWAQQEQKEEGDGPYLTYLGEICNAKRLEEFLTVIGAAEDDILLKREEEEIKYRKKKRQWDKRDGVSSSVPTEEDVLEDEINKQQDYQSMINLIMKRHQETGAPFVDGWTLPPASVVTTTTTTSSSTVPDTDTHNNNNNNKIVVGVTQDMTNDDTTGFTTVKYKHKPQSRQTPKGNKNDNEEAMTTTKDFKGRYYYEKLHFTPLDVVKHNQLRQSYIEGLMWCLAYYYKGCISWGWYFPYHYGPMLSDLIGLEQVFQKITFELGEPLLPFEQLLGCLPPASSALVPRPYRILMTSPDSPLRDFYPTSFQIDMNGKKNPWEGVNLLPFINIPLLKQTMETLCPPHKCLTAEEQSRNQRGLVYVYYHDWTATETLPSFNRALGFDDIPHCHSRVETLQESNRLDIPFQPVLVKGTQIPYAGYPSLNVLPIASVERLNTGLNCFGTPSKYPNTILKLHEMPSIYLPDAQTLATQILGKHVFINYPMMHEAKVVAVCDSTHEVRRRIPEGTKKNKNKPPQQQSNNNFIIKQWLPKQQEEWKEQSMLMQQQYLKGSGLPGTGGINIGTNEIEIRLLVKPLQGMKVSSKDGSTKKVFGQEEADIPIQMCLWSAPAPDPRFIERGPMSIKELYPPQCRILLTKGKYKGCLGIVLGIPEEEQTKEEESSTNKKQVTKKSSSQSNAVVIAKVHVIPPEPPFGLAIAKSCQDSYISSQEASKLLKLDSQVLGKVMGSLLVEPGRYDLGLNLRYTGNGNGGEGDFYVTGYTRKVMVNNEKTTKTSKSQNVWLVGDTVRVFGSQTSSSSNDDNDDEDERSYYWEYTPKAIRLVAAYRAQFPHLFQMLQKYPKERKYDAMKLQLLRERGAKGNITEELTNIRDWLNQIETAKLPRSPTTTLTMPSSAIAAIQRAAEVRTAKMTSVPMEEVVLKLPTEALYREGSRSATDIVSMNTVGGNSASSSPQLGDRIVNVCANGIPFGARGTVVSIHYAKHSGCVEVVMDDEFIGGSNLQGACKNFRGKLVVWNHLLKITAADSSALVQQMLATATSSTAGVSSSSTPTTTTTAAATSATTTANQQQQQKVVLPPQSKPSQQQEKQQQLHAAAQSIKAILQKSPSTTSSTSQTPSSTTNNNVRSNTPSSRTGMTPIRSRTPTNKMKQGAWREAKGPPPTKGGGGGKKGTSDAPRGFLQGDDNERDATPKRAGGGSSSNKHKSRGARGARGSGLALWKAHVMDPIAAHSRSSSMNNFAAVFDTATSTTTTGTTSTASAASIVSTTPDALKAMLGIGTSSNSGGSHPPFTKKIDTKVASNNLKAVLGVGSGSGTATSNNTVTPPVAATTTTTPMEQQATNTTSSAADAFMKLVIQDQPMPQQYSNITTPSSHVAATQSLHQPPPHYYPPPYGAPVAAPSPSSSKFNFTYVPQQDGASGSSNDSAMHPSSSSSVVTPSSSYNTYQHASSYYHPTGVTGGGPPPNSSMMYTPQPQYHHPMASPPMLHPEQSSVAVAAAAAAAAAQHYHPMGASPYNNNMTYGGVQQQQQQPSPAPMLSNNNYVPREKKGTTTKTKSTGGATTASTTTEDAAVTTTTIAAASTTNEPTSTSPTKIKVKPIVPSIVASRGTSSGRK